MAPDTGASIPYEGTDCTAEEAVEAVKVVRATAADREVLRSLVYGQVEGAAPTDDGGVRLFILTATGRVYKIEGTVTRAEKHEH